MRRFLLALAMVSTVAGCSTELTETVNSSARGLYCIPYEGDYVVRPIENAADVATARVLVDKLLSGGTGYPERGVCIWGCSWQPQTCAVDIATSAGLETCVNECFGWTCTSFGEVTDMAQTRRATRVTSDEITAALAGNHALSEAELAQLADFRTEAISIMDFYCFDDDGV